MYLSKLEMVGFKSFANRTVLNFEQGMTAVVGPNGCGKSNISDAIRWVLGEQSAKAMRGKKMQDCIFEGTDSKQRLGMAEVSLTLSDCEEVLGMDYNEVTVTRRVFRSGESEYLINKVKCRLKDVQRLFMDTGVGTNSYSVMEQGRIDYILSARPEDRRTVFEEASGITKFKADKKEALRKLEHTEANLLRLDDIIREVKRQIISLQRQAGKARRYQTMREELRGLDIYLARNKIEKLARDEEKLQKEHDASTCGIREKRESLAKAETEASELRQRSTAAEERIESAMRAESDARAKLEKNRELIEVNADRIEELKQLSERDSRDAENARANLTQHEDTLRTLKQEIDQISAARDGARAELERSTALLRDVEDKVDEVGTKIHSLRSETIDLESRYSNLQNEVSDIDAREHSTTIRRERLNAELSELESSVEDYGVRDCDLNSKVLDLQAAVEKEVERLAALTDERKSRQERSEEIRSAVGSLRNDLSAQKAKIEIVRQSESQAEGFSGGARKLLSSPDELGLMANQVIGSLADHLVPAAGYGRALEVALRSWMDAVVMRDYSSALEALSKLAAAEAGSARMLSAEVLASDIERVVSKRGEAILKHVEFPQNLEKIAVNLLGRVFVVDRIDDSLLSEDPSLIFVTKSGEMFSACGFVELWMPTDEKANPLARKQLIRQWEAEVAEIQARVEQDESDLQAIVRDSQAASSRIDHVQQQLEERRTQLAIANEEHRRIKAEAKNASDRLDTVRYELKSIAENDSSTRERREAIKQEMQSLRTRQSEIRETISNQNEILRDSERERSKLLADVTDKRVAFTEKEQRFLNLGSRQENLSMRVDELKQLIEERAAGVDSYKARIANLQQSMDEAAASLSPLRDEVAGCAAELESARGERHEIHRVLTDTLSGIDAHRSAIDDLQSKLAQTDIALTEQRMRRENIIARVTEEYHIEESAIFNEPEPEWEGGVVPPQADIEERVAAIKHKLDQMGPVNLVAIDEHRELEDRYEFLRQQHEDLTNSREHLLSMIKEINKTTTEMFIKSFNSINDHFKELFKEMFGGGNAKLELSEDGDILESGIEINARPPGKKLQTVSLLSGGERTMTAIALLFALYLEKPSAFCLLDELDAALDESNIGRFLHVVGRFLEQSQFIVITHNQKTIAAADVLYGVTMEERGVSKIVSVKFHGKQLDLPEVVNKK